MQNQFPRILIGAFRGGAGKTLVSLGLLASWRSRGKGLSVFKKGPDYIDAAWLSSAASAPCYNLDTYLMGEEGVLRSFEARTSRVESGDHSKLETPPSISVRRRASPPARLRSQT